MYVMEQSGKIAFPFDFFQFYYQPSMEDKVMEIYAIRKLGMEELNNLTQDDFIAKSVKIAEYRGFILFEEMYLEIVESMGEFPVRLEKDT